MNYKILLILVSLLILSWLIVKKVTQKETQGPKPKYSPNYLSLGGVIEATGTCAILACTGTTIFDPNTKQCINCTVNGTIPDPLSGNPPISCKNACSNTQRYVSASGTNPYSCVECGNGWQTDPNDLTKCKQICPTDQAYINNICTNCTTDSPSGTFTGSFAPYLKSNGTDFTRCIRKCDTVGQSFYNGTSCVDTQPLASGEPTIVYDFNNTPTKACDFNGLIYVDKTGLNSTQNISSNQAGIKSNICKSCASPTVSTSNGLSCEDCNVKLQKSNAARATNPTFATPCQDCGTNKKRSSDGTACISLCSDPSQVATWSDLNNPVPSYGATPNPSCTGCSDDSIPGSGNYKLPLSTIYDKRNRDSNITSDPKRCGWVAYYDNEIWTGSKNDLTNTTLDWMTKITRCSPSSTSDVGLKRPNKFRNRCIDKCDVEDANGNPLPLQTKVYVPTAAGDGCVDCNTTTINNGGFGPGWIKGVDANGNANGTCRFACDNTNNYVYNVNTKQCECCPYGTFPKLSLSPPKDANGNIMIGSGGYYHCDSCSSQQYPYFNGVITTCINVSLPYVLNRLNNPNGATPLSITTTSIGDTFKYTSLPSVTMSYYNPANSTYGGIYILTNQGTVLGYDTIKPDEIITGMEINNIKIQRMHLLNLTTGAKRIGVLKTEKTLSSGSTPDSYNFTDNTSFNGGLVAIFTAFYPGGTAGSACVVATSTIYRRYDIPFTGLGEVISNYKQIIQKNISGYNFSGLENVIVYGIIASPSKPLVMSSNSVTPTSILPVTMTLGQFNLWGSAGEAISYGSSANIPPYNAKTGPQMVIESGTIGFLNNFWVMEANSRFYGVQGGNMTLINTKPVAIASNVIRSEYIITDSLQYMYDVIRDNSTLVSTIITGLRMVIIPTTITVKVNGMTRTSFSYNPTTLTLQYLFGSSGANLLTSIITNVSYLNIQKMVFYLPTAISTTLTIDII